MDADAALEVRVLGGFRVLVGGRGVPDGAWRQRRAAAVVKLLALAPGHRLHREQVAEALWPELAPEAAANNLRVALHHARRAIEGAGTPAGVFLVREGEGLALGPADRVRVDVDAFEEAVGRAWRTADPAAVEEALDRYAGDVLPEDPYEEWVASRRGAARASYLTLLARAARVHEGRGELERAIAVLERLVAAEPLDEEAQAALVRLLALSGQRRQALARYDRYVALLESEVGSEPGAATRDLAVAIREGRFPVAARPGAAAERATAPAGGVRPARAAEPVESPRRDAGAGRIGRIPAPVERLIGRERELAELRLLLASKRLVTLTGPGGVGKTRLALGAARMVAEAFPDGGGFVDLAPLREPGLVLAAVAAGLGVREAGGASLAEAVAAEIGERRLLLVLDNFEHLVVAAPIVTELLAACPGLTVLVTGRMRLRLRGEQEYPVQPLPVPERAGEELPDVGGLAAFAAVALFVERAAQVQPGFALAEGNAAAVAEVCRRLDGLPLALELAAARVRLLPPPALLARLGRPLALLTGGARDAPARQRTLRATIAWSYDLLAPEEQDLFARLAVFAGGASIEAVEHVELSEGFSVLSPESSVLDVLGSLIEQSLVRETGTGEGAARVGMLETIREFALERLEAGGEAEVVARRHAAFFLAMVEEAEGQLTGPQQAVWLDRLEVEHDNVRAALATLERAGEPEATLRLAGAMWRFWWLRGHLSEGREWLRRSLAEAGAAPLADRARALDGAGVLAESQGDDAEAEAHHEAALALWRELGDRGGMARSLLNLGIAAEKRGDPQRVTALQEAALALSREADDRPGIAAALANQGFTALDRGDHDRAAVCFAESLLLFRELNDQRNLSVILDGLAALAFHAGDFGRAAALFEEALALLRGLGDRLASANALANLGHSVQQLGDVDRAAALYAEALGLFRELGDRGGTAFALTHLGRLAHRLGDGARARTLLLESFTLGQQIGEKVVVIEALEAMAEIACDYGEAMHCARLLGATEALREAIGVPLPLAHDASYEHQLAIARAALGEAMFAAARGEGRTLASTQSVAALADLSTA